MNFKKSGRLLGIVAAVAMLTMVLQGCGGGDDNSVEEGLRADVEALTMQRDDALSAQAAAEAAQAAAMDAQTAAEAAQATAEMQRDTANTAKGVAEEAARVAAQAQMDAETAAQTAMDAQTVAETAAQTAMDAQTMAEGDRDTAVALQEAAEMAQATAETARMAAEEAQRMAEAARATAEEQRDAANTAKTMADAAAQAAMDAQTAADAAAQAAMTAQAMAEGQRDAAVEARTAAEAALATAREELGMAQQARDDAIADRDKATTAQTTAQDELADEQAKVMRLEMTIGNMDDPASSEEGASLHAMLNAANDQVAYLEMKIGGMDDDASSEEGASLHAMLNAANAQVDYLEMKIGDEMDDASADGSLHAMLNHANAAVKAATDRVAELDGQLTDAERERDMYKDMVADQIVDADRKERMDRGNAIQTAISGNRVGDDRDRTSDGTVALTPNPTMLPFDTAAAATGHGVTAERDVDGMVTIEVKPSTMGAEEFEGGEAMAGEDWTSAMLTRNVEGAEEVVVVYTDIEAPTPTPVLPASMVAATAITEGDIMLSVALPDGASLPIGGTDEAESVKGTYRGTPGTFTCPSECGFTMDADDGLMVDTIANVMFQPDEPSYDKADNAYVYFGWWLHKPTLASQTHRVEAFTGGNMPLASTPNQAIEGEVKYEGPAAGKYVTKTTTAGVVTDAAVGHFTATASLTADFGEDNQDVQSINGKVDGFVLDDGTGADASNWRVTLNEDGSPTQAFNGTTNVTFGGLTNENAGNWQGQFYGQGAMDEDAPDAVAGTFDAHDPSASITGAFGAHVPGSDDE
jgi:hypothetical protein